MRSHLCIDGRLVDLRVDFESLIALEARLDCGVMALSSMHARGLLSMSEMVEIVALCAYPPMSASGLGDVLIRCGVSHVANAIAAFFCAVLQGSGESQSEAVGALDALMARFPD